MIPFQQSLCCSDTTMYCWCITKDAVGSNRFIKTLRTTCREMETPMLFQCIRDYSKNKLSGNIKQVLDSVYRHPTKKLT
jgi:hypothetical protein